MPVVHVHGPDRVETAILLRFYGGWRGVYGGFELIFRAPSAWTFERPFFSPRALTLVSARGLRGARVAGSLTPG